MLYNAMMLSSTVISLAVTSYLALVTRTPQRPGAASPGVLARFKSKLARLLRRPKAQQPPMDVPVAGSQAATTAAQEPTDPAGATADDAPCNNRR